MKEYREKNNGLHSSNTTTPKDDCVIGIDNNSTIDEIEKLSWQIFVDKLGLSFRRELTAEEKKSITDKEDFQYYRDLAIKHYNEKQRKKEKAILNKKYPIIDIPASGNKSWMGGAFSLTFVYSKYGGNFILRGYVGDIDNYLEKNHTHYFCNRVLFGGYNYRNIWSFWKKNVHIFTPDKSFRFRRKKYEVKEYDYLDKIDNPICFKFKRLPKRWIPEFDLF